MVTIELSPPVIRSIATFATLARFHLLQMINLVLYKYTVRLTQDWGSIYFSKQLLWNHVMEIFCLIYFFLFWRSRARSRYSFLNNVYPDLELCDGDWQHKVRVFVQIDAISFQMQNPILTLKLVEKITIHLYSKQEWPNRQLNWLWYN